MTWLTVVVLLVTPHGRQPLRMALFGSDVPPNATVTATDRKAAMDDCRIVAEDYRRTNPELDVACVVVK